MNAAIRKAEHLLRDTDVPPKTIAHVVGFASQATFSRASIAPPARRRAGTGGSFGGALHARGGERSRAAKFRCSIFVLFVVNSSNG